MDQMKSPESGPSKIEKSFSQEVEELQHKLEVIYKTKDDFPVVLEEILKPVQKAFGSLSDVKGKRILDLGCGSNLTFYQTDGRHFEPWFCRALKELGADVIGVDRHPPLPENFEYHQIDLVTNLNGLSVFREHSFDGINIAAFFDAPDLQSHFLASFPHRLNYEKYALFQTELGQQIKRLLKAEAKYVNIVNIANRDVRKDLGL